MHSLLILVDRHDSIVGTATWEQAHASPGLLHRAFSAYVFRKDGTEILIQKRSHKKPLFSGLWANSCCSHPRQGEEIVNVAPRRLQEELGFVTDLTPHSTFIYQAEDPLGRGAEHEHVTILRGDVDTDVTVSANPDEVGQWTWMNVEELKNEMKKNPEKYAPWFHIGLHQLLTSQQIIKSTNQRIPDLSHS